MLQLIREELRRGAVDAAVSQWRRLGERVPERAARSRQPAQAAPADPEQARRRRRGARAAPGRRSRQPRLHARARRGDRARGGRARARGRAQGGQPRATGEGDRAGARLRAERAGGAADAAVRRRRDGSAADGGARLVRRRRRPFDRSAFGAVDDLSAEPAAKAAAERNACRRAASPKQRPAEARRRQPPAAVTAADEAPASRFPSVRVASAVPLSLGEEELMIYVSGKGPPARLQPHHSGVAGGSARAGSEAGGAARPASRGPAARRRGRSRWSACAATSTTLASWSPSAAGPAGGAARAGRGAAEAHARGSAPRRSRGPRPAASQVRFARRLLGPRCCELPRPSPPAERGRMRRTTALCALILVLGARRAPRPSRSLRSPARATSPPPPTIRASRTSVLPASRPSSISATAGCSRPITWSTTT